MICMDTSNFSRTLRLNRSGYDWHFALAGIDAATRAAFTGAQSCRFFVSKSYHVRGMAVAVWPTILATTACNHEAKHHDMLPFDGPDFIRWEPSI